MWRLLIVFLICLLPLASSAQETADGSDETSERDRDFLTGFLEDNLSGVGRDIRIEGFRGALSSRATFDLMTIADAEGVWLTLRDGAISWKRSALLAGRVEISEMSAQLIELPRRPSGETGKAEASGFSLPELPVAVSIGTLRANRVVLGQALFGAAAEVSVNGTMQLEGGEGSAELSVDRIDGRTGTVSLTGSYANATRKATLDLLVSEGPDGIAANLIGLPGAPSVELAIHGNGIIDDFRTDISLLTDEEPRLTGTVTLIAEETTDGGVERRFAADLGGDIAPLLLPEYQEFFGSDVALQAEGKRLPSGQLDLTRLVLSSRGVDVSGRLSLSPGGLPIQTAVTTRIGLADNSEVLLPIPGEKTYLKAAELTLRYNASQGDGWKLSGDMFGLRQADIQIAAVSLDGSGRIARPGQGGVDSSRVGGHVRFSANGIELTNPAAAEAFGPNLGGRIIFHWQAGSALKLPVLDVAGQGYSAKGGLQVGSEDDGVTVSGRIAGEVADMARFSGLAKRSLGGAAYLAITGSAGILSGIFDAEAKIEGRDLTVSQPEIDRLLAGLSAIDTSIQRDTDGLKIQRLNVKASSLTISASGDIKNDESKIHAALDFADLAVLGPRYRGSMSADAVLTGKEGRLRITLDAKADDLGVGQDTVDKLIGGVSTLSVVAERSGGKVTLENLELINPQVSVTAEGVIEDEARRIDLAGRLNNMALLAPGFPGPLTIEGRVAEDADGYAVDLSGQGPGATSATVEGRISSDYQTVNLSVQGGMQSAIFNPFIAPRNIDGPVQFDLRLVGPVRLDSLSGRVGLNGARLVAPTFGIEFEDMNIGADLSAGRAVLSGGAGVRGGGRVDLSGPVTLTAPFASDLSLQLSQVSLLDPDLYKTAVDGSISIRGPIRGATISGAVTLDRTEVRVPSTGFGSRPTLTGLRHINEPAAVRRTRAKAGFDDANNARSKAGGPSYGIDMTISAPGRIFVRGRGLDAEMDGSLRLTGTTDNIVPSGQFNLVRGRLDILGKRFTIDEGLVELQGALTPYIRFSASAESDGITATIVIEGEASEPEIKFVSTPELPEEEVVSHLLFGRSLTSLSPLQAAQLASAIAELAGRGGEGIVSRLRSSFGLDDLDVTTDSDGSAALRAGKYLSENVYTDVTIGADGKSEINLNLDVRPGITVRGSLGSDGETGVGVFFERDY